MDQREINRRYRNGIRTALTAQRCRVCGNLADSGKAGMCLACYVRSRKKRKRRRARGLGLLNHCR